MRVAGIDLGTNTFILLVADTAAGEMTSILRDDVRVIRLGQGVNETRRFHPEALARADECLADFARICREMKVDQIQAVATSAARDVANSERLLEIGARHGIPINIVSGDKEAEYTFSGTITGRLSAPILIIDIGGGSTEFVFGDQGGIRARISLDIGSVRLTEKFITAHPIAADEFTTLQSFIRAQLERAVACRPGGPEWRQAKVIAVAGTPTTLATLDQGHAFESNRVHGHALSQEKISAWLTRLSAMTVEDRRQLAGMEPKRADVLPVGAMILSEALNAFAAQQLEVSVRGLRYGIAKELAKNAATI